MLSRYLIVSFTCLFGLILPIKADAQVVAKNKAVEFVRNFFASKTRSFAPQPKSIDILNEDNNQPALYIVCFPEKGFVILAADSAAFPVVGYSL